MGTRYIILFAQVHEDFRIPELRALDELLDLGLDLPFAPEPTSPFLIVTLRGDREARLLGTRAVLIRHIIEHWAGAETWDELHSANRAASHKWVKYAENTSFKVSVSAYQGTLTDPQKVAIVEELAYMDFKGRVRLRGAELEIVIWEEHFDGSGTSFGGPLRRIWMGKMICEGQRHLIDTMDLKKRVFIGNTSMEATMSILMANMAHCRPGTAVLDPFCGTGSMLYPAAHFGSLVFGCDIDGRQMRGKGKTGIMDSAAQYGVEEKMLGFMCCDLSQHPWRTGGLFDAIVTDPPYGVRAGAKRLGRTKQARWREEPKRMPTGEWSHERSDYIHPTMVWEMSEVVAELLRFSRCMLKVGGRLVYWLPTTDEYQATDVPSLPGLELVANSGQDFHRWQRRLITMRKTTSAHDDDDDTDAGGVPADGPRLGHADFRNRYFSRFEPDSSGHGRGRDEDGPQ